MRIAIALFDGAEELDWAGPWEVLSSWALRWPDDGVEVLTVAESDDPIRCAKGLRVLADRTWDQLGTVDVLVYPGGIGTRSQLGDERIRERVRSRAAAGTLMTSVCTGSLVFADAGLLDGRPATTHWRALKLLATLGQRIEVRPTRASSTTARSSPQPACRRASMSPCTSSRGCTRSSERQRCDARSNTTPSRRSSLEPGRRSTRAATRPSV